MQKIVQTFKQKIRKKNLNKVTKASILKIKLFK